tara:strand:+ start:245 stop:556 length:312 start_codon:yes stop_codon:yes gene_type:complete
MLNWILDTIFYKEDNIIDDSTELRNRLKIFEKKRSVRIIENYYLSYKKKLELRIKRAEKRKLYRILNRTNNNLLNYLKSSETNKNNNISKYQMGNRKHQHLYK